MSWGSKITNNQGDLIECALMCANHAGCQIVKVQWPLSQVLSSVDRCSQGINDYGVMELRCNGFAPKPVESTEVAHP